MAGRSKGKEKAKGPARRHPEWDKIEASAKIRKRSASSRRTVSARSSKAPSKATSAAASPAPPAVNGKSRGDREVSTPSSDSSQAVKDFYAHMEATSSESSRWDTDSVLGAVLEDLTDETGSPGGEINPLCTHYLPLIFCYALQASVFISLVVCFPFLRFAAYILMPSSCCLRVVCVLLSVLPVASLRVSPGTTRNYAQPPFQPYGPRNLALA